MKRIIFQKQKRLFVFPVLLTFSLIIGLTAFGIISSEIQAAEKEFRIGISTSFKMEAGSAMINGAQIAAEEINAKGGILGRQIKLLSADTESNPEKGITALKRLVEKDKVHILMGAGMSGVLLAQMDFLDQYNIIFMNTGASSPLIAKKVAQNYEKYKYQFRTPFNAMALAKAVCEDEIGYFLKLGYKKFAVLAEDAAWNRGLVGYLKKSIQKLGGTVTTVVTYDTNTIDFAPIFSKIASSGAEFAITLLAHTDTITLFKQWYEMKAPFRMGGFNNPGMFAEYWKRTGGACIFEVNVGMGAVLRAAITNKTIPFFDKYVKKFGSAPHGCAGLTYDGMYIIADAARRANSIETGALIKALEETNYIGTLGRIVFDKKTHDPKYGLVEYIPFLITQWQEGGKFVVLWPERFATAKFVNPPWLK